MTTTSSTLTPSTLTLNDIDIEQTIDLDVETSVIVWSGEQTWRVYCKVDTAHVYCGSNDPSDNEQCRTYNCNFSKVEELDEDGEVVSDISETISTQLYMLLSEKIEIQAEKFDDCSGDCW